MNHPVICRSCRMDAGLFGIDKRARHACSYDYADHKVRSINWVELPEAFVITHANGTKLAKKDWIVTTRGKETRFNTFLLRAPRIQKDRNLTMDMTEMMAEARERAAKLFRKRAARN